MPSTPPPLPAEAVTPPRFIAPSTGDPITDADLALLAIAILHGHRRAGWQRGWDACIAGRPIPRLAQEGEGWMSAFHALTWLEPGLLAAVLGVAEGAAA